MSDDLPPPLKLHVVERDHILNVLHINRGRRAETAKQLGIAVRTLYAKLKQYESQGFKIDKRGRGTP